MQKWIDQTLTDARTGEKLDSEFQLALILPKRENGFKTRWLAVAQDPLMEIVTQNKEFGAESLRVLLVLIGTLDFDNLIIINQSEMARKLHMKPQNFHRAIKKLIKYGIILEGDKVFGHKRYRLNPLFGWKGSSKRHKEVLRKGRFDNED